MASFDPLEVCIVAESEGGSLLGFRPKQSNKVIEFNGAKETEWDLPISEVFKCQTQDRLSKYGKRRLDEIVRGPEPFTESEVKIVEALRMYRIEAEPAGEHFEFKIQNGSSMELDHITLGAIVIRQRAGVDGRSISYGGDGRLYLDVSGILPGRQQPDSRRVIHP